MAFVALAVLAASGFGATAWAAPVSFAVIGDYGLKGPDEAAVALLVHSWGVDFVITTGDNNYPSGQASAIDANIGFYYQDFICPYTGAYGAGAAGGINRFFPTLGNHDYLTAQAQAYLDYFSLPGNERYYDFAWGPVHFFALDSVALGQPYGTAVDLQQAQWLRNALAAAPEPWKIVYEHYPPYSSAAHGSTVGMRWPFAAWGANAVLSGHEHVYERLEAGGIPYFVVGAGGHPTLYPFRAPLAESLFRYNAQHGALLVVADTRQLAFEYHASDGTLVDSLTLVPEPEASSLSLVGACAVFALAVVRRRRVRCRATQRS